MNCSLFSPHPVALGIIIKSYLPAISAKRSTDATVTNFFCIPQVYTALPHDNGSSLKLFSIMLPSGVGDYGLGGLACQVY